MDKRSPEEFERDILKAHQLEDKIAKAFAIQISNFSGLKCSIIENGVDNSGKVLEKLKHHNADKIFKFGDEELKIEINTAPHTKFFTFKVGSLKSCMKQDATILLHIKQGSDYYIINRANIEKLLELPHQIYFAFSPNDKAVRIMCDQFGEYMKKHNWCEEALELLKGK